ncbi:MAG: hypothetical protein V1725_07120 [archaeon]
MPSVVESVGSYLPDDWIVSNEKFLSEYVRGRPCIVYDWTLEGVLTEKKRITLEAEKIKDMTGIEQRYYSPADWPVYRINAKSAEQAMGATKKEQIEGIINAGVTSNGNFMTFPSHATMIQLCADLKEVKYAFDVATHKSSYETALEIVEALNIHQPGVYIAVFSRTRQDIATPSFFTNLYGSITGIEVFKNGTPSLLKRDGWGDPGHIEETRWHATHGSINEEYDTAGVAIQSFFNGDCSPEDVKGIFVINQVQEDMPLVRTNAYEESILLGLPRLRWCFDIAAACSSSQMGFAIADGLMPLAESQNKILLAAGETLEKITDLYTAEYMDANNMLFGTGTAAFLLGHSDGKKGFVHFDGLSDPFGKYHWIHKDAQGYLRMPDGSKVMKYAIRQISDAIVTMVKELEWQELTLEHDTHNANDRIFTQIPPTVERSGIRGTYTRNIHTHANTSAASPAMLFAHNFRRRQHTDLALTTTGIGSGMIKLIGAYRF